MRQKNSGKREAELYRIAAFLFNKNGYASTSVRQICRALGIRESSLYHYIRSKEDLLYNICERALLQGLEIMTPIARLKLRSDVKMQKMIETHVKIICGATNELSTMLKELKSLSVSKRRQIIKIRDQYQNIFYKVVADCIQKGHLPKVQAKIATMAILGMMNWIIHWYSVNGPIKSEDIAKVFSDLIIKSNAKKKRIASGRAQMINDPYSTKDTHSNASSYMCKKGDIK
jgi:AcrR family transcriptional regulator